jgi:hypothetical protein
MSPSSLPGEPALRSPDPTPSTLPAVRVEDDTQVSVESGHFVLLEFDDLIFDTAGMHPGNGKEDRIRLPVTGTYLLSGEVEWEPHGNGYRTLQLVLLNRGIASVGKSLVEPRDSALQATIQQVTAIVRQSEGTTIGLMAGQGSGVPLEVVRATISAAFLSP